MSKWVILVLIRMCEQTDFPVSLLDLSWSRTRVNLQDLEWVESLNGLDLGYLVGCEVPEVPEESNDQYL